MEVGGLYRQGHSAATVPDSVAILSPADSHQPPCHRLAPHCLHLKHQKQGEEGHTTEESVAANMRGKEEESNLRVQEGSKPL